MVVKPQIGFSYDCRRCEKQVFGISELFPLRSHRGLIRCECGESALVAQLTAGFLQIEYPCSICGLRHRAVVPLRQALGNRTAILHCPVTELPACMVGQPDSVHAHADELTLLSALRAALAERASVPMASDVLCTAKQMAADGRILCRCGSARIRAGFDAGILQITCSRCGAMRQFSVKTAEELHRFRKARIILSAD